MLTTEKINTAKRIRRELMKTWERVDELLYREFRCFNQNIDVIDVAYKVNLLNKLYNCGLPLSPDDTAELIVKAEIDSDLRNGDPIELVERIATLRGQKRRKQKRVNIGVVFASKYCHFHEPDRFAIYDQYARCALEDVLGRKIEERNYRQMKTGVDEIRNATGFSYKDIDEYLWVYGQYLAYRAGKKIAIISKHSKHLEIFSKLIPEK